MPIEIAASKGWVRCVEILLQTTAPLEKFEGLSIDQMVENEKYVSSETQLEIFPIFLLSMMFGLMSVTVIETAI